mmetsp:Transcript_53481/g.148247  ORF Transcript_53481/g.148247 Transcript_53481/m.148247 type:complete len:378 (+) Transcript_53481:492-1625(+)
MRMPATMPEWIEYVNGTTVSVRKDGIATRRLSQLMPRTGDIMKAPMRTSGTAVATCGTAASSGAKNAESRKSADTTTAEKPVRAPSMMPALLSFAMITGLVPKSAPTMVPIAELEKMEVLLGTVPSCSKPAMPSRPYCTPARSNSATKSSTRLPMHRPWSLPFPGTQPEKSTANAASNLGTETAASGASVIPKAQEQPAMSQMPMSSAPCTPPLTSIAEMTQKPAIARHNFWLDSSRSPSVTSVSLDITTRPMTWKPISAWKMPIATVIAFFRCSDRTLETIQWQTPHRASTRSASPLTKQQLRASCHVSPSAWQMPYAKYAFSPMPGIRPRGASPKMPATSEPTEAEIAVAVMTASGCSGSCTVALLRMTGFTTMM